MPRMAIKELISPSEKEGKLDEKAGCSWMQRFGPSGRQTLLPNLAKSFMLLGFFLKSQISDSQDEGRISAFSKGQQQSFQFQRTAWKIWLLKAMPTGSQEWESNSHVVCDRLTLDPHPMTFECLWVVLQGRWWHVPSLLNDLNPKALLHGCLWDIQWCQRSYFSCASKACHNEARNPWLHPLGITPVLLPWTITVPL